MLLKMMDRDLGSRPESWSGPEGQNTDRSDRQINRQAGREAVVFTKEGEGFPSVSDSVGEHQRVSSQQNPLDQTPNRTLEHLPLTGLRTEHLSNDTMKSSWTGHGQTWVSGDVTGTCVNVNLCAVCGRGFSPCRFD